jgi:hypothetical protein
MKEQADQCTGTEETRLVKAKTNIRKWTRDCYDRPGHCTQPVCMALVKKEADND